MLRIFKPSLLYGGRGRIQKLTYCKQDEVLLVVLTDTVIDPGTVVVHLPDAPLTNTGRAHKADVQGRGGGRPRQTEPTL